MTSPVIIPWKKGYKILNRYEIMDIKKGGMGIVYIVHDHEWNKLFAVKTFQNKYIWNDDAIRRFYSECETWIKLDRHTNIVIANSVLIIEGKPLLFLEYVEGGDLNQFIRKFTIEEALDFAVQFCTGMEYAYQNFGVIHRDIKPANILVRKYPEFRLGYCFKITDFGLVKALGDQFLDEFVEVSTVMGTLPFMPPEQFPKQIQDKFSFQGLVTTRSDIYSFGVTLYLLLTGKLPFSHLDGIFQNKPEHPIFLNPKIPENLDRLILRCLEKNPDMRYYDFNELKEELIKISNSLTGKEYPFIGDKEIFTEIDWNNKGLALKNLGKLQEALECYDNSIRINPRSGEVWNNKGFLLQTLGKNREAIECYNKSLEINPGDDVVWNNKGMSLVNLRKLTEAIGCFEYTHRLNPGNVEAWVNKGIVLSLLGKLTEALGCYDKALEINPRDVAAWNNKGMSLDILRKPREALECFEKSLEINSKDAVAWHLKGIVLIKLGKNQEAQISLERFKELAPEQYAHFTGRENL